MWPLVRAVFTKELRETFRDWKALVINYGMPLIVYPILFVWMAEAASVRQEKESAEKYTYARIGVVSPELDQALKALPNFEELKLQPADAQALLKKADQWTEAKVREPIARELRDEIFSRKIHTLIHVSSGGADSALLARIFHDPTNGLADRAADKLSLKLEELGRELTAGRVKKLGLTMAELRPLASKQALLSGLLRAAIPKYGPVLLSLLMLVLCLAAYYPALGATVSERESGTLQTLLSTPVRARELVLGKFLAVWASSLMGVACYALPGLVLYSLIPAQPGASPEILPLHELPWLALAIIGLSVLIAATSLVLGLLAKRLTEAQALLSVLLLSAMLPLLLVTSGDIEFGYGAALVPLVNLSALAKTLFVHPIAPALWLLTIAVNVLSGLLMLGFAVNILENETKGETAFVRWKKNGTTWLREPTADLSFLYYAAALALAFYGSLMLTGAGIWVSLFAPQLLLFVGAPILIARGLKLSREETFLIRKPSGTALFTAGAIAFPLAAVMGVIITQFKFPQAMMEEFQRQLGLAAGGLGLSIAVAIVPAICEEFAFRGLILSGLLRRFTPQIAITASALMFAFMHVSLIRFLPTFIVGLMLGSIAFRTRSIWPGMLTHGLYNLTLILIARFA